jgi:hypothetical protein
MQSTFDALLLAVLEKVTMFSENHYNSYVLL